MNFDQKAVKFLANFHISGGEHWTHGPLKQKPLVTSQPVGGGPPGGPRPRACFPPGLERRPPVVTNLGVPGPTRYRVPDASARECSSLPHSSPSARMHPTRDGGGCRAWQTVWFPRESPVTQNDFNWEQWPSPADYQPPSPPACPAFSFGGRLTPAPPPRPEPTWGCCRPGVQGCGPSPSLQVPLPTGLAPSPTTSFPGAACRAPARPLSEVGGGGGGACTLGPAAYGVEDCYNSHFPSAHGGGHPRLA
ncbi:protein STPG3 [Globicephala melas]|uniref:protein STPG3 n=1 Tax=Globicephala melas TaxID=9731 RepID=UPI00293D39F1|nr:protein STPG3 [Globicephala melas]